MSSKRNYEHMRSKAVLKRKYPWVFSIYLTVAFKIVTALRWLCHANMISDPLFFQPSVSYKPNQNKIQVLATGHAAAKSTWITGNLLTLKFKGKRVSVNTSETSRVPASVSHQGIVWGLEATTLSLGRAGSSSQPVRWSGVGGGRDRIAAERV